MNEKTLKHSLVFGIAPDPQNHRATLFIGITKQAWSEMQGDMAKDLDLAKAGLPIRLVLFGADSEEHALEIIKKGCEASGVVLEDRRGEDFSIKDDRVKN